ncbi:MAG TPA: phosphoenolpyruvate--protein phosphotransferase [Telmatospirillum sp.]|nr:phosphoenolpyruvate--protein phosphotransferase [Telmatospirillum sp.]
MAALKGIAASPGVIAGPAFVYTLPRLDISEEPVTADRRDAEAAAFLAGRLRARDGLCVLIEKVRAEKGDDLAGVFEGHLEILMDDDLEFQILAQIEAGRSALAAVRDVVDAQRKEFLELEDEYLRERADDLADIGRRLIYATASVDFVSLATVPEGAIIVARDLTPSDTAQITPGRVGGFAVETGGRTSHSAIMARTLELPAVVGCAGLLDAVEDGVMIALDGRSGDIVIDPDDAVTADYAARRKAYLADREAMLTLATLPATTTDGTTVLLGVNIGTPADALASLPWNPDGVGLYRSEFLFMDRPTLPSEDEQFKAYATVVKAMKGKSVILRTLDIGGDKPVAAIRFPEEDNPFLGWRGIRMCLYREDGNQDILRTQLRAALRAAAEGDLWIMYPMISALEEVEQLKVIQDETKEALSREGRRFGDVKTGIMIETPGAALIADKLAKLVDFFSIGSNDLTQYTLAADRGNERVSRCYQPFHPAVWRLIALVIDAGKAADIPVGMCGELAGIEEAALPLLGLGLDEFSMGAQSLPRIKRIIRATTMGKARAAAQGILAASTAAEAFRVAETAMNGVLGRP